MLDPAYLLGKVLDGSYRLVRFIGQGGTGYVYEAEELLLGERIGRCAVKLVRCAGSTTGRNDRVAERVIKADQYKCEVRFVGPGLDDSGVAAKRNPTGAYRPSAAVKARVKSTDFHVESSTVKFTPHKQTVLPPGTTSDANGFPRRIP